MAGNTISKTEKIFKALGDKSRLRIINMVAGKPLCVCEITQVLKLSQSTVSGHLRVLKDAGLLSDRKDGLWVEYSLCRDEAFSAGVIDLLTEALKNDPQLQEERSRAFEADRDVICSKGAAPTLVTP